MATREHPTTTTLTGEALGEVLRNLPGPVVCVEAGGTVTLCNPAAANLFGFPGPAFLLGRDVHQAIHRRAQDGSLLDAHACPIQQAQARGERVPPTPCTFWRVDGTPVSVEVESVPLQGGGALMTFTDLAGRRRLEEELAAGTGARLASVRGLAKAMAHEMNTPVQFLGINVGFLRHAFTRMEQFMGAVRLAGAVLPAPEAGALRRLEEELDLEFLEGEVPKVLAECMEGLGKINQVVTALGDITGPAAPGGWEDTAHAS